MRYGREIQGQAHGSGIDTVPDFHNPYNFIPAPPRITDDPELGDHTPIFQDQFYPDRITGRIQIEMEAITPLLIPDPNSCREGGNGHKTFGLLQGNDGKPLIPSSSIRGMLRAAYETVTNSRLGRFPNKDHGKHLAYRMEARDGLSLIPARINNGQIYLLTGTSSLGQNGVPQYAAWLPRYSGQNKANARAVRYPDGSLPKHGEEVECWVELIQHHRWDRKQYMHKPDFMYWRVCEIVKTGNKLFGINQTPIINPIDGRSWHKSKGRKLQIHGWVCITNANISRKHDERVFFCLPSSSPYGSFPLTETHRKKWRELIENYQEIHEDELKKRAKNNQAADQYLGSEPGSTAWSRHVYTVEERELRDGTLCYVSLVQNQRDVEDLFPVMISRKLYSCSPWDLLHASLRPASKISELSPADRVFGWVLTDSGEVPEESKGQTAVRGLLRVGPVKCVSSVEASKEVFSGEGLPLSIMAAPKSQQGRFYVAKSQNGDAQNYGLSKNDAGYDPNKGLRGRKVYPHHNSLTQKYWENPLEDRTQTPEGPWQEYRRPMLDGLEQRDDQNRSILGWVKPSCRFEFDIHVSNLSKVELGALLYLLNLPKNHFHRFGGGKPLGFGSVRLNILDCDLLTGETLKKKYYSWALKSESDNDHNIFEDAVAAFKNAVERAYLQSGEERFEQISFIKAFFRSCKGFDDQLQIHYPRATDTGRPGPSSPNGESFKWFVANEKNINQYALGDLADDNGLPTLQDPQSQHH